MSSTAVQINLGNPAPLGLIAFAMTTMMLMYIDMGWIESDSEALIYGCSMIFGGLVQLLVGCFELVKGSSFSFCAFTSYGAFWMTRASVFIAAKQNPETFGEMAYPLGMTAYLIQWGILSGCFWIITWRKNICLITTFGLLTVTFFLLAIAHARENATCKTTAGYFGFATAVAAFYTAIAELINEDYGRHILPGLTPMIKPERVVLTKEVIMSKFMDFDVGSNTLFLYFRGFQINSLDQVRAIREAVVEAIETKATNNPKKAHVIVDYKDVTIAKNVVQAYWNMASELEGKYYLSVRRFAVSSFGTITHHGPTGEGTVAAVPAPDLVVDLQETAPKPSYESKLSC